MAKKKDDPKWMSHLKLKEGAFTQKAKRAKKTVAAYAEDVLSEDSGADAKTRKQAVLAQTFKKAAAKRKKKGGK